MGLLKSQVSWKEKGKQRRKGAQAVPWSRGSWAASPRLLAESGPWPPSTLVGTQQDSGCDSMWEAVEHPSNRALHSVMNRQCKGRRGQPQGTGRLAHRGPVGHSSLGTDMQPRLLVKVLPVKGRTPGGSLLPWGSPSTLESSLISGQKQTK